MSMVQNRAIVLGIESSCDETAAGVYEGPLPGIRSNIIATQFDLHHAYGGVVPELASRRHIEVIDWVVKKSLYDAQVDFSNLDLVAVTTGPGLVGSLLIGLTFAKTLCLAIHKPLIGVNHLEAHLYAPFLEYPDLKFPLVSLVVSGGHTLLVWVKGLGQYEILGTTFDDAAGEAYDKVAKLLGLGYPGGPILDQLATQGNPKAIKFPRPMLAKNSLDFSFSGLKTSVLYFLKGYGARHKTPVKLSPQAIQDLAASFQEAMVDVLVEKTLRALEVTHVNQLAIGGGVAANTCLRKRLEILAQAKGFKLYLPSHIMCTDNAAMIAGLCWARYNAGLEGEILEANPRLKI